MGDRVLIGGFIIQGTAPKKVLLRAIGPSLAGRVPNFLEDPVLELRGAAGLIATNDNWEDTDRAAILATGAQPSDDRESALVRTLAPGAYTTIVSGFQGGTGVGLVEAYDIDPSSPAHLVNISTRGVVEEGDNVLIGGLIVGGSEPSATFLIRALGPSLGNAGVPDPVPDPILQLHDENGVMIAFDDNWRDLQETAIEATTLAPGDSRESAILTPLAPGSYTAIVRNKDAGVRSGPGGNLSPLAVKKAPASL
ncbi:MAG: hypothetical protein ACR2ID_03470 [Chthoniobacterales bacterium]